MLSIYPFEDGLNECAMVRTTFETFALFPENDAIRAEMQAILLPG